MAPECEENVSERSTGASSSCRFPVKNTTQTCPEGRSRLGSGRTRTRAHTRTRAQPQTDLDAAAGLSLIAG